MADESIILLAEDSEDDAFLCQRALKGAVKNHRCIHVTNGEACIHYLAGSGPYTDREQFPFPNLLLLDLKMPIRSGFQVLEWLSRNPQLKRLPVVILTGSEWEGDRTRALSEGASEYQVKPGDTEHLRKMMTDVGTRWLIPAVLDRKDCE